MFHDLPVKNVLFDIDLDGYFGLGRSIFIDDFAICLLTNVYMAFATVPYLKECALCHKDFLYNETGTFLCLRTLCTR